LAPFKSCRVRIAAIITSSKRLDTLSKQSSTVILAMVNSRPRSAITQGKSPGFERFFPRPADVCFNNGQRIRGLALGTNNQFIFGAIGTSQRKTLGYRKPQPIQSFKTFNRFAQFKPFTGLTRERNLHVSGILEGSKIT
jgi:hypothetical protein